MFSFLKRRALAILAVLFVGLFLGALSHSRIAHAFSPNDGLSPAGALQFVYDSHGSGPVAQSALGTISMDACATQQSYTVTNAAVGDAVEVAIPSSGGLTTLAIAGKVSSTGTVKVDVCNRSYASGYVSATPLTWAVITHPTKLAE